MSWMSTQIFSYLSLTESVTGALWLKDALIPDPSLEVDDTGSGGAVLLLTSHRFPKLKRLVSGFLAVGV